jgi:hypothetical protein
LNRQVGLLDIPIFDVDVIRDVNNDPLAPDAFIEITSTRLRAYSNYSASVLDFELDLNDHDDAYFLRDVEAAFTASTFFSVTVVADTTTYEFYRSNHLRFGNTNKVVFAERLYNSRSNKLENDLLIDLNAQSFQLFQTEVGSADLVNEPGEYYIDYINGVVFTQDPAVGYVTYTYRDFPYRLFWQPVRAYPNNDDDLDYLHYDNLISDETGLPIPINLNSEGARITNAVLSIHSLGWGQ